MFATLLGRLPIPPTARGAEHRVRAAIEAQERAGIDLMSDGGLARRAAAPPDPAAAPPDPVVDWRFAASLTIRPVKQTLTGPYSANRGAAEWSARERATLHTAEALRAQVVALRDAGCPFVEIAEPGAVDIGADHRERRLFVDAHRRLIDGVSGTHLSLAVTGGNADSAGAETFFDLPYASYALDLIAGPNNWRLVTGAPHDRGIVCGALSPRSDGDDGPEVLVWAAHYAASGRGLDRVGLANAPGLDALPWDAAIAKLTRLADAARVAELASPDELAAALDPRAVSSRSAALGHAAPPSRRRRRPGG